MAAWRAGQGAASRAGKARRRRAGAGPGARGVPPAAVDRHDARRASRSSSRRHPSSTAGRSRACGRRARSRSKPSRAYYYLTDVDRSWPPERQKEHMRDFNFPTLWNISIHEVYPGHFLHYQHLRQVESKVRKSTFFAPPSFVEGWAHYCEQMMIEAGFRRGDADDQARPARRSARPARAVRRRHPAALRGSVGGAGDALLPRRGVPRGSHRAARGRARHVRSRRISCTRSAS